MVSPPGFKVKWAGYYFSNKVGVAFFFGYGRESMESLSEEGKREVAEDSF